MKRSPPDLWAVGSEGFSIKKLVFLTCVFLVGSSCSESIDNRVIKGTTVESLRSEFQMGEALVILQECSKRSSCKPNLESIGLKQILVQKVGSLHKESYGKKIINEPIVGYTVWFDDSNDNIVWVDASVNPLVEGKLDEIEKLVGQSYSEETMENGPSLYWLGRFSLGDQGPTLKIMIYKQETSTGPSFSLRYVVTYD